jgi:hypothetical protein
VTKYCPLARIYNLVRRPLAVPKQLHRQYYLRATLPKLIEQARQKWLEVSIESFQGLRQSTLSYVASNHRTEFGIGAYSYLEDGPPLLYASCYAALTRHLYGDLNQLSDTEKIEWAAYLQKYQEDDGLFHDPLIDCPQAASADWWGWRHLTLHVLMTLTALGGTARKPFCLLDNFRTPGKITEWLESRNWKQDAACVSNEIQNYATMLQYAKDFQGENWCNDALEEMYQWLDTHQDPQTGYWGYGSQTARERSWGVQTGYHLWLLYFYDGRPIKHVDKIIDSCLVTQNRLGGFGVPPNSSACEDIDSIDPLVRLSFITDYRREDIRKSLGKAVIWVLTNLNADGGWVFRRGEGFRYGHDLMWARTDQSSMFPTWFRTLSLAYISQVLSHNFVTALSWQFIRCPGYQFWC